LRRQLRVPESRAERGRHRGNGVRWPWSGSCETTVLRNAVRPTHGPDDTAADLERQVDPVSGELDAEVAEDIRKRALSGRRRLRVTVCHGIGCKQLSHLVRVTVAYGCEKASCDMLPLLPLRCDRLLCGSHHAPCAKQQPLESVFADPDHASRLGPTSAEDMVKQEGCALDRQELLEQQEAPQRERFRFSCVAGVAAFAGHHQPVGEESLSAIGDSG
jgi:hypothetical protein